MPFEIRGYHAPSDIHIQQLEYQEEAEVVFYYGLEVSTNCPPPTPPPPLPPPPLPRRSGHGRRLNGCFDHPQRGKFHISYDASLHTILSSFRTHVILSVFSSVQQKDTFISHCSQISAGDHMQIIGDPIGAVELKV